MIEIINNYKKDLIKAIDNLSNNEIQTFAEQLINARNRNANIFVFGNGGSGSTASHMVCDIIKGCSYNKKKKFKMICLNDNIPTLLAYSNDVSYDIVFVEQLKNFLSPGDLVVGISGSGNSKNIIEAIDYANSNNAITFGFTGYNGGLLKEKSKYSCNANINDMQISEDIHLIVLHIIYKLLEKN